MPAGILSPVAPHVDAIINAKALPKMYLHQNYSQLIMLGTITELPVERTWSLEGSPPPPPAVGVMQACMCMGHPAVFRPCWACCKHACELKKCDLYFDGWGGLSLLMPQTPSWATMGQHSSHMFVTISVAAGLTASHPKQTASEIACPTEHSPLRPTSTQASPCPTPMPQASVVSERCIHSCRLQHCGCRISCISLPFDSS